MNLLLHIITYYCIVTIGNNEFIITYYYLLVGRPGMQLNSSSGCQDVGFTCPFVVIDPTDLGATTAVARNLLQD